MNLFRMKCALILALVVWVWPCCGFGDNQLLFQPPATASRISLPAAHPLHVTRQLAVAVNMDALQQGGADQIVLNLFDDVVLSAVHMHTDYSNDPVYVWYGIVDTHADSRVILVVRRERLSAVVRLAGWQYKVWPIDNGLHVVRQIPTDFKAADSDDTMLIEATLNTLVAQEQEVLRLVKAERNQAGLHALTWDTELFNAARDHSLDMATHDYFSHEGQDGRDPFQRMADAGYARIPWGENIAYGYGTPEAVMAAWMESDGHRSNILHDTACDLGVGYAIHANTGNRPYWTQNFGAHSYSGGCSGASSNQLPVALFVGQPTTGTAPLHVDLDASDSYDPDGQIVGYQWDFGDGQSGSGVAVEHIYTDTGSYTVRLTVVDNDDAVVSRTETDFIVVNAAGDGPRGGAPDNDGSGSGGGCFINMGFK